MIEFLKIDHARGHTRELCKILGNAESPYLIVRLSEGVGHAWGSEVDTTLFYTIFSSAAGNHRTKQQFFFQI